MVVNAVAASRVGIMAKVYYSRLCIYVNKYVLFVTCVVFVRLTGVIRSGMNMMHRPVDQYNESVVYNNNGPRTRRYH